MGRFGTPPLIINEILILVTQCQVIASGPYGAGLYPAILGKGPWPKLGKKIINLVPKLGKIFDIKQDYRSKIYPKIRAILVQQVFK